MLREYGVKPQKAWEWANTRKCYGRVAGSPVIEIALTNARLRNMGWLTLTEIYEGEPA